MIERTSVAHMITKLIVPLVCRGDIVNVRTWFQSEGRVGARRDWQLTDATTGQQLGCATSSWVMLNFKTRRLSKMPDDIMEQYKKAMPKPPQHAIPQEEARLKLPEASDSVACIEHRPRAVHKDMNGHVNNTAYLTWILDSMPEELMDSHSIAQYEVDYKAEAQAGVSMTNSASKNMRRSLFCELKCMIWLLAHQW